MEDAHPQHGMISALGLEAGRRPAGRSWTHTPAFTEDGFHGLLWPPLDPHRDLLAKMRSVGGAWQLVQPRGWCGAPDGDGACTLLDQILLERGHVVVRDARDVYIQLPQHVRQPALRKDLEDIAQAMNRQRSLLRGPDVDDAAWHAARTRLVSNFELLFMDDEDASDLGSDFDFLELCTAPTSCGSSRASYSDDDTSDLE